MGQKVSPTGFRLGITEDWRSRWYADKDYAATLENDLAIRKFLDKELDRAAVSRVEIERAGDKTKVIITTARPGVVIGKKGAKIDELRRALDEIATGTVSVEVIEVKRPELDAKLVAESIAEQLVGRVCFPSRYAQGCSVRPQERCQGHPHPVLRPSGRRRDEPPRVVRRRPHPSSHPACEDRLRFRYRSHHDGLHRRSGLDLSRRCYAWPEGSAACTGRFVSPESSASRQRPASQRP